MARWEAVQRLRGEGGVVDAALAAELEARVLASLDDDLDTPAALDALDWFLGEAGRPTGRSGSSPVSAAAALDPVLGLLGVPGVHRGGSQRVEVQRLRQAAAPSGLPAIIRRWPPG